MREPEIEELERILANEEELQPMTGFSTRVMRAVREEAAASEPIAFPWVRFLPGFLVNVVLLCGAAAWMLFQPGSHSPEELSFAEWLANPQVRGALWASLTMIGSGVMAWATVKWVSPPRVTF